jgi:aminoglycoside phosphotransferase (APT) family kinase protein
MTQEVAAPGGGSPSDSHAGRAPAAAKSEHGPSVAPAIEKEGRAAGARLAKGLSQAERDRRLLEHLRARLACPELRFEETPRRLLGGSEAAVVAFRLANAPPPFDGPLVLRRFQPGQPGDRSPIEAGIHDAARAAGVPTPRCLLHETRRDILGAAFLVLDWVEGEALLGDLAIEALGSGLRPRTLWRMLRKTPELLDHVAVHLADAALPVATIDAAAVESAVRARGGPPQFLSVDARLARIERRIKKYDLGQPLAPALAWLAAHRPPPPERPCLVHGDIAPTNLLVRDGEVACLLDWSKALLAEPEAEVGFLRVAVRTAAITGLGSWNRFLRSPLAGVADRATEQYVAARPLDPARLRWYETLRALSLLASIAKRRKSIRRRPHLLDAFRASKAILREIEHLTGTRLSLH